MPTQVSTLYSDISRTLLEDNGLSAGTGIITDDMFFKYLGDVVQDFLNRTGVIKKLGIVPLYFGLPTYAEPEYLVDVQSMFQNQIFMPQASGWFIDSTNREWQLVSLVVGTPEKWREDETAPRVLQVSPSPNVQGHQVTLAAGQSGYGTISSVVTVGDFTVLASNSGYGTIAAIGTIYPANTSNVYFESMNAGYGTISSMCSSISNLEMLGTVQPTQTPQSQADYLFLIPDSAVPCIKYGILYKIWTSDSECRDDLRAKYAQARYVESINLFASISGEMGIES